MTSFLYAFTIRIKENKKVLNSAKYNINPLRYKYTYY